MRLIDGNRPDDEVSEEVTLEVGEDNQTYWIHEEDNDSWQTITKGEKK